jgi:hypothetical protein
MSVHKGLTIKLASLLIWIVFFSGCSITSEPNPQSVEEYFREWKSKNIKNYTIEQQRLCFCIEAGYTAKISVTNNIITNVVNTSTGEQVKPERWYLFKTIEELFSILLEIDESKVHSSKIEYDEKYYFPTYFYVDPIKEAVDEEYGYRILNFTLNGK